MPNGMPYTPAAYAYSPVKYVGESGSIPALLLYEAGGLCYVRFRVRTAWPYYDGWSNWDTVGLFPEHVVAADPHEPAIADLLGELDREAAAQQQHLANCRHHGAPSGAGSGKGDTRDGQVPVRKPASAKVTRSNGAKPSPVKPASSELAKTPGGQRKTRTSGGDGHSLKPVRSIAGLTITDFLYDR